MMRPWTVAVALAGAMLVGCGDTEAPELATASSALSPCGMRYDSATGCNWFNCTSDISYEEACAGALRAGTDYCSTDGGVLSRSRLCYRNSDAPPYQGEYLICCAKL